MDIKTDNEQTDNKHNVYDGIVEQNNPMPGWWIWLFIFTVIFGAHYWLHYAVGGGPTLMDEYNVAIKEHQNTLEKNQANASDETEDSLLAYMKSENSLLVGAGIYVAKCAMCHGVNLEGKIGSNLTDQHWVIGNGSRLDIVQVITKGSVAKGMPPWQGLLKPNEIKDVAAYVFSKIGSKPANPKTAEGTQIK